MDEQEKFRVRITFQKLGRLRHLSHLEVARSLERAVRRAGLPYAVSQGFSPHMKIAFGSALPVGVGGCKECFDLQLTAYVAPNTIVDALRRSSVSDLMVLGCQSISKQDPAASVAYPIGEYEIILSEPLEMLIVPEAITVIRKKKEKQLTVADYLFEPIVHEGNKLRISLIAKQTGSLRIDLLVKEILKETNIKPLSIIRTDQKTF